MKHAGVERPAKVPASAVPHWQGVGWVPTDPPAKPKPITLADVSQDPVVDELLADAPPLPADQNTDKPPASTSKSKPKAAPTGRKED